ncbi:hypothetical protein L4D20_04320 [Vibrio kyushuensis]|uniref:hypothetical protein n=1 Tax=Vibrio kyushuensis TaxID=2910249 RepID=UPI003D0F05F4
MDSLKVKAIEYFAAKPHDDPKAQSYLSAIYNELQPILNDSNSYGLLSNAFDILDKFISHISIRALQDLTNLWARLHDNIELDVIDESLRRYHTKVKLNSKIISLLSRLRYLEQNQVVNTLLRFWEEDPDQRSEIEKVFKELSEFNLHAVRTIGFDPQTKLLETFNKLPLNRKLDFFPILNIAYKEFLETEIEGHNWEYHTVSIQTMALPVSPQIINLREGVIVSIFELYQNARTLGDSKSLIILMNSCCRTGTRNQLSEALKELVENNTIEIHEYWSTLIKSAPLELVQIIEHNAYWNYYHGTSVAAKNATLMVKEAIEKNLEYQIYRDLVGYEGIFNDWEEERTSRDGYGAQKELRDQRINDHIESVSNENILLWLNRVEHYLKTESKDLATFPELFHFVESIAERFPNEILSRILETSELNKSLIWVFRGVWKSHLNKQFRELICEWIENGQYLWELSSAFSNLKGLDYELVSIMTDKCILMSNTDSLCALIRLITFNQDNFGQENINDEFKKIMIFLNSEKKTNWVNYVWYNKKSESFINVLSDENLKLLVDNLVFVSEVDHRIEGVLEQVAENNPEYIFYFFQQRVAHKKGIGHITEERYEDIPYSLSTIKDVLAKHPDKLLSLIKNNYDYDDGIFQFGIASLFKKCFPVFEEQLIDEILNQLNPNNDRELKLILALVTNYEGNTSILPLIRTLLTSVACTEEKFEMFIHSLNGTGVVHGEYGLAKAYERKKENIQLWEQDEDVNVVKFAFKYKEALTEMIRSETRRTDEQVALEKHKFGFKE